jgi:acetylornithine deacetylase
MSNHHPHLARSTDNAMAEQALQIAQKLIRFDSVSSKSNIHITQWIADRLTRQNFSVERLHYVDASGVDKHSLVAKRGATPPRNSGSTAPEGTPRGGVAYCCHSDVVPADDWSTGFNQPFDPRVNDGRLYGRGACDMKGSAACALAAIESLTESQIEQPIYFVCTADEEIGFGGADQVARESQLFAEMVQNDTVGIIGEPTNLDVVHAHKGSTKIQIVSRGVSAHSSSDRGINANLRLTPILQLLADLDAETKSLPALQNLAFSPSGLSWNYIIRNEPAAINITPSLAEATVFFRTMPEVDETPIIDRVVSAADKFGLEANVIKNAPPLWIEPDSSWITDMLRLAGKNNAETVCFGTDAAYLHRLKKLLVCGPGSIDQAHRCDEFISLDQLALGTKLYRDAFEHFSYSTSNIPQS